LEGYGSRFAEPAAELRVGHFLEVADTIEKPPDGPRLLPQNPLPVLRQHVKHEHHDRADSQRGPENLHSLLLSGLARTKRPPHSRCAGILLPISRFFYTASRARRAGCSRSAGEYMMNSPLDGRLAMRIATAIPLFFAAAIVCAVAPARAHAAQTGQAASNSAGAKSYELDITASKQWVDTNIDLRAGEKLHITGTGTITYPAGESSKSKAQSFGPDGLTRGWADLIHQYAVTDAGHGALIGRLGSSDAAQPFSVGTAKDYEAPVAGRLFLGINQSYKDASNAQGSFHVAIDVVDPGLSTATAMLAGGPAETRILSITAAMLGGIPRRVTDPQGNPGDMV